MNKHNQDATKGPTFAPETPLKKEKTLFENISKQKKEKSVEKKDDKKEKKDDKKKKEETEDNKLAISKTEGQLYNSEDLNSEEDMHMLNMA